MRPKVFAPYRPQRWDRENGCLIDVFPDLDMANEFGDLSFLLTPNVKPFDTVPIVAELREKLAGFTDRDYVLLVGNPIIMSLVATIAADSSGGLIKFLQWSRGQYVEVEADLGTEGG
jgi:hypothetical protein